MIGIGATLFKVPTMHRGAAFSPASLFSSGEEGAWYDPSDLSTLFQIYLIQWVVQCKSQI